MIDFTIHGVDSGKFRNVVISVGQTCVELNQINFLRSLLDKNEAKGLAVSLFAVAAELGPRDIGEYQRWVVEVARDADIDFPFGGQS